MGGGQHFFQNFKGGETNLLGHYYVYLGMVRRYRHRLFSNNVI